MYDIPMQQASNEFARCWQRAGAHIETCAQGKLNSWLRAHLNPPFLEHLSFRLGNQLFFIRLEDEAGHLQVPGSREGLLQVSGACRGHACLMPMRRGPRGWAPVLPGWGLAEIGAGKPIDPPALITDAPIEMTDWELHDFAVQVVRDWLVGEGCKLMSWQPNPEVDPSIWVVGEAGPEWVVVRAVRFPESKAPRPRNLEQIARQCSRIGRTGHFASVAACCLDTLTTDQRLLRGHGLSVRFEGLEPLQVEA